MVSKKIWASQKKSFREAKAKSPSTWTRMQTQPPHVTSPLWAPVSSGKGGSVDQHKLHNCPSLSTNTVYCKPEMGANTLELGVSLALFQHIYFWIAKDMNFLALVLLNPHFLFHFNDDGFLFQFCSGPKNYISQCEKWPLAGGGWAGGTQSQLQGEKIEKLCLWVFPMSICRLYLLNGDESWF